MKVLPTIKNGDIKTEHIFYETGGDIVKGRFTKWNKDHVEEIMITKSTFDKKIELVNYCDKTDSIEIHFFESSDKPFKKVSFNLNNCKIDCLRVLLQVYQSDETITSCSSVGGSLTHPETKKGNILQGNP